MGLPDGRRVGLRTSMSRPLFSHAERTFAGLVRAREWLETALPALGGQRPIDLCDTFEGRRLVQDAIRRIEYGEFP